MMRYMPMMVTCEEADRFIDDYLSGELPTRQRLIFDWHIRLCPGCREYLKRYRRSVELARDSFYDDAGKETSEEMPREILDGILAARPAGDK